MNAQWENEINLLLADIGWELWQYPELKRAGAIPKTILYFVIRREETTPQSILEVKEFGVIGLVQNKKVLDTALLNAFQHFLTDGYERYNKWWEYGIFDKIAQFGILSKKGKSTVTASHYPHPTSPVYILDNDTPELMANSVVEAIKMYQKKLSENHLFIESLKANLNIEILPSLSDVSEMYFRTATQNSNFGENATCLQTLRHQAFLLAQFAFQYFPQKKDLTVVFRNSYLESDRFLIEISKLHAIQMNKQAMDSFTDTLFGKSEEIVFEQEGKHAEQILAFITAHETERVTSSRPIDK